MYVCMCMHVCMHVPVNTSVHAPQCKYVGQRTTLGHWFLPSTLSR